MKNKTRFSAGNLVSQGPRALSTYGVGRMRRLGRVPDALSQIGRLTRHDFRWPLNFPNLIISLARFGQVPEGQLASPGSIYPRTRRLIIEIRQIWGWVSAAARFAFSPRLLGLGAPGRENSTVTRAPAGSPKHAWGRVLEIHRPIFNRDAFPSTPFTFITYLGYRDSLSLGCSGIPLIGGKSPPTGGGGRGPTPARDPWTKSRF